MIKELKSCPHCAGCPEMGIERKGNNDYHWVYCFNCGARVRSYLNEIDSINNWNHRIIDVNEHARLIKYLQFAYQAYDCNEALELIYELGIEK